MTKPNKKALYHQLNMMYQLHGQATLIAEAVKYNEKNTYQVAFEHCKGCEAEMPSIDHECIACGQTTNAEAKVINLVANVSGYYAKSKKGTTLYQYKIDGDNVFWIIDDAGIKTIKDINKYDIVNIEQITAKHFA